MEIESLILYTLVAQWMRATGFYPVSCGFESRLAFHSPQIQTCGARLRPEIKGVALIDRKFAIVYYICVSSESANAADCKSVSFESSWLDTNLAHHMGR